MSVEQIILIAAILMPVIALLLIIPKLLKQKLAQKKTKPKEQKQENPPAQPASPTKETPSIKPQADDFSTYAQNKSKKVSHPKRNFPTPNFTEFEPIRPRPFATEQNKEKSVAEEFKSLSPQLKALILSGAFDRKDFDD